MKVETRGKVALLLLSAAALLPGLAVREIWDRAEGRTCVIARDIVRTGRVQPPWIAGAPYLNKPPLYHAMVAASFYLRGREDLFAARLPAVLMALIAVACTRSLGRLYGGPAVGLAAGVFLLACHRFFTLARSAELEILLTAGCAFGYLAMKVASSGRGSLAWSLAGALGGAIASLGKAPQLAVVFAALFVAGAVLQQRNLRPVWATAFPAVLLGALLAALAYYLPLWNDPEFRPLLEERLRGGNVLHRRPPWYYLTVLPAGLAPAVVFLPRMVAMVRRDPARWAAPALTVLLGVVAFSFSSSKQSHYLLPLYPLIAVMGGGAVVDALRRGARLELLLLTLLATLTGLATPIVYGKVAGEDAVPPTLVILVAAAASLGSAAMLALARWHRCPRGIPPRISWLVAAAVLVALTAGEVARAGLANREQSPARVIRELRQLASGRPLGCRLEKPHALWYLDRPDAVWLHDDAAARTFLEETPGAMVFVVGDRSDEIPPPFGVELEVHLRRFRGGKKGYAMVELAR